jgi:hypothetical protein
MLSTQNQHTVSAAAYTASNRWLPTQGCCKRVLFTCLFTQMVEFNLEQTNCIHVAQTPNRGSDFVKGSRFHFLDVGKTLN